MIVQCPFCHYREAVPEEYAGKVGECSNCGKDFRIPSPRPLQQQQESRKNVSKKRHSHKTLKFIGTVFLLSFIIAIVWWFMAHRTGRTTVITLPGGVPMEMIYVSQGILSKGFWMGKYEVTQAQWMSVMGRNPSEFSKGPDIPVVNASWKDCQEFIQRVNMFLGDGSVRLPTEKEWEFACRAGKHGNFGGTGRIDDMGIYNRIDGPSPVGSKKPNDWGFFDMHGNAMELCSLKSDFDPKRWRLKKQHDSFADDSYAWRNNSYAWRGGNWGAKAEDCTSSSRAECHWTEEHGFVEGLRLVREPFDLLAKIREWFNLE